MSDYWIGMERESIDYWLEQEESEHDQIVDWLDTASTKEIIDVWYELDKESPNILSDVVEAVYRGENVTTTFRNRIAEVCEREFDRWKETQPSFRKVS